MFLRVFCCRLNEDISRAKGGEYYSNNRREMNNRQSSSKFVR